MEKCERRAQADSYRTPIAFWILFDAKLLISSVNLLTKSYRKCSRWSSSASYNNAMWYVWCHRVPNWCLIVVLYGVCNVGPCTWLVHLRANRTCDTYAVSVDDTFAANRRRVAALHLRLCGLHFSVVDMACHLLWSPIKEKRLKRTRYHKNAQNERFNTTNGGERKAQCTQ